MSGCPGTALTRTGALQIPEGDRTLASTSGIVAGPPSQIATAWPSGASATAGATPVGHGCTSPGDCAPGELCSFPSLATIGTCLLLCDPLATNYPCGFDRVSQFPLGCTAAGGTENYGICPDNGYAVVDAGPG